MLPGLPSTFGQGNVFTHRVKASVNNLSFGQANSGGAATFLNGITIPIDLHIHVDPGVTLGSASFAAGTSIDPALFFLLPAGSRIYITNRGTIWGGGGRGGDGDRGRLDTTPPSASGFVGGGGGGGAGPGSVGGLESAVDFQAGNTATNGTAATPGSTSGGAAGVNSVSVANGGYAAGVAPQRGGDAIQQGGVNAVSIYIDNVGGLIYAGANGGQGGVHNAPGGIPAGTQAPVKGDDTAGSMTVVSGSSSSPKAVGYANLSTLTWVGGGTYPSVRGVINQR